MDKAFFWEKAELSVLGLLSLSVRLPLFLDYQINKGIFLY